MRVYKNYIVFSIVVILFFSACSRKLIPSGSFDKTGKGYDSASFNYVYVEAIKQKLMGNGGDALKYLEQCIKINPQSDASYYQMAQIVIANGDAQNGKKYLSKAISIDDQNMWYLMMIAGLYYQEKNLDSAIYFYETAVKSFPEKENLQVTLGNLYSENRQYEKANKVFSSLDQKYGVNEATTVSSIESLIASRNFDEALVKAKQLVESNPEDVTYNSLLAETYRAMGESGKALQVYREMIGRNPNDGETLLSLSDFLIREKYYDELFTLLNSIIINGDIKKEDKVALFGRLLETPEIVNTQGDRMMLAIRVLEAGYPGDKIIPRLRPELLIRQNKLPEAAVLLEEQIKKDLGDYYAWEKLLIVYLQMGDYQNLMARGEQAATMFNRSFVAKVLYANGALENGKYDIALEELKKAEILAGEDKQSLMQVLTMRADIYYRMKDYGKAFETFGEALKNDAGDLTTLNNYAYYLAEQNMNLKEAEEMAKQVVEKEKSNTTFLDTYAWVLYKRGKLNEAAKIMESIITSGEKPDAEWFEHYGYILKKQRKCAGAIEKWNVALKLDPTKDSLIKEIENCKR